MRIYCYLSIALIVFITRPLFAQGDYEKWLQQEQGKFQQFKEERDREFSEFLKREWQQMQIREGLVRDEKPKPVTIPRAEPVAPKPITQPDIKIIKDIPTPKFVPVETPDLKEEEKPIDVTKEKAIEVEYFGISISVTVDRSFGDRFSGEIDNKTISQHWGKLCGLDYQGLVTRTLFIKDQMSLNDWGYGMLLDAIADAIHPVSPNDKNLFLWFILSKSGYEARLGYMDNRLFLLIPSKNSLYGVRHFVIEDKKFYIVSFNGQNEDVKSLYTYKGNYPGATDEFSLAITAIPKIKNTSQTKDLKFKYGEHEHIVNVKYNAALISFFKNYPQTNLDVYFGASLSADANLSLVNSFKPIIETKNEVEAVNLLLRFVQTAFEYKTDDQQFGREKFLFAEETLFYPYSDCEDRSVLFSYLVQNLLNLDVIGLDYPGHIATAVHFSGNVDGDFVMLNNKKYTVCDPTFINANIGKPVPQVQDHKPEVIPFLVSK